MYKTMHNLKNRSKDKKGFTLAELLIVVAIIAVLVAIAIPIFTGQLERAKEAADMANIRAAYAEACVKAIEEGTYKHVEVSAQENPFYTIVPSAFALSGGQAEEKSALESKDKLGSINTNNSTSAYNPWDDYVMYGFGGTKGTETLETKEQYLTLINTTWELAKLVKIYQDAYDIMTA